MGFKPGATGWQVQTETTELFLQFVAVIYTDKKFNGKGPRWLVTESRTSERETNAIEIGQRDR